MADERREDHRQVFLEFVEEKVTSKNNTTLSDEDFTEIVKYLKGSNSKWVHSKSLGKRIQNNGYPLLDYPALGLKEVLCVPDDKNAVSNISFRFYAGLFAFPHTYLGISQ